MQRKLAASIVLLTLLTLSLPLAGAQRRLLVSASVSTEPAPQGLFVSVTGSVKTETNLPVENTEISIQVINSQNSSVFVGLIFSGANGGYAIRFTLPVGAEPGNYSIFITATKPGFEVTSLRLSFAVSNPDFSLLVSPRDLTVRQGQEALFTVTVAAQSGFNSPVNLTLAEYPPSVTFRLMNSSLTPPGSTILAMNTTRSTPPGSYNITVVGLAGGRSHSAKVTLQVEPSNDFPLPTGSMDNSLLIAIGLVGMSAVVISALAFRRRSRSELDVRKFLQEAKVDRGYLATARALARLEELHGLDKIDRDTYEKVRKELEARLRAGG